MTSFHSNQLQSCPPRGVITTKMGRDDVIPFLVLPTCTCYSQTKMDCSKYIYYLARTGDVMKEPLFFFSPLGSMFKFLTIKWSVLVDLFHLTCMAIPSGFQWPTWSPFFIYMKLTSSPLWFH